MVEHLDSFLAKLNLLLEWVAWGTLTRPRHSLEDKHDVDTPIIPLEIPLNNANSLAVIVCLT